MFTAVSRVDEMGTHGVRGGEVGHRRASSKRLVNGSIILVIIIMIMQYCNTVL
jgi:hypothetical protein